MEVRVYEMFNEQQQQSCYSFCGIVHRIGKNGKSTGRARHRPSYGHFNQVEESIMHLVEESIYCVQARQQISSC